MIGIKNLLALLFVLHLASLVHSQPVDSSTLGAAKLKKAAANAERYGDYYTALNYYSVYASKNQKNAEITNKLAQLLERNRDYASAAQTYLDAYQLDDKDPQPFYDHIRMVKMTGKVKEARAKFEDFYGMLREKGYDKSWKKLLRTEINSCDTAIALMADSLSVKITNLGNRINGPHQEFAPIPLGDSVLVFGSLRENTINYRSVDSASTRRQLYISRFESDGWSEAELWNMPFNTPNYHVVNGSFNQAGDYFVFTRCAENWKKEMNCQLWSSRLKDGTWQASVLLEGTINEGGTIVTQPAFAYDQRKERDVLYFVSNNPEGEGGMDIYYTYYNERSKEWRAPKNLGRRINGAGDEITPYFQQKEQKLYYSSNSLSGMGGLDIYSSRGELSKFAKPENVGYPINSSVDDFYFVIKADRESGFFASNRSGGYQMLNETCCDDLYSFGIDNVIHINMEGFVMRVTDEDYVEGQGDVLSSSSFNSDFLGTVNVDLFLKEEEGDVLMQRLVTDGDGVFKMEFEAEKEYRIVLSKPGYFTNHVDIDTRNVSESKVIRQNIGLSEISLGNILIRNINYEFDSADLSAEAQQEINKGILNMLLENPGLTVEIGSHTDDRGDDTYNEALSQRRADNVVRFLTERGIPADRLKAKGYGESSPIAGNTLPDGSDNPQGRAANRRTEFKILENREMPVDKDSDDN